jgi:hypothetical protein
MNMKKIVLYSFLALVFVACRKSDNPKIPELTRVPVPKLSVVPNSDAAIDVAVNPAGFKANFNVDLLFPEDVKPQKMDVVVRKNGAGAVKIIKTDVTTYPTNVQVTGQQLIDLFGANIVLGDFFDFATDIYLSNGQKIDAFPATGIQFSGGTANIPTSSPSLRYAAICKYDPNLYSGIFVVVQDDWQDTNPGDQIVFTKIDATHFSYIYPSVSNPIPIVVAVNTGNNTVSITKQVIGSIWNYGVPSYTQPTATTTGPNNNLAPCDKTVTMSIDYGIGGVNGGTFGGGPYVFKLKKQ